ncbi:uncharacterized protein [Littorina saxatilis]|uniref:uncharacterized protein isoform X2 n=1 Tax=Littorina saxatilis TaxID=31220 RepID=UPI0038B4D60D
MSDNGGGSPGADTAVLVDTLVQIQHGIPEAQGKEIRTQDEPRPNNDDWTQSRNWVSFDDITIAQPIGEEDQLQAKTAQDNDLSCLRPPPQASVPKGEITGVHHPGRGVAMMQGHPTAQPYPAYGSGTPHGSYNPQLHSHAALHAANTYSVTQAVEPVQWLPGDSDRCHAAIRQYTVCTTSQNLQMNEMRTLNNVPVVEQPQPVEKGWGGGMSPAKPPSNAYLFFTIIAAFLSIFCCLCTGVAALVVAIQAALKRTEGKNTEARQKLVFSLGLVVASLFIFAPTITVIILTST